LAGSAVGAASGLSGAGGARKAVKGLW
jgi:hypothetical protein